MTGLFITTSVLVSQMFAKAYGLSGSTEQARSIVSTPDGGFAVLGYAYVSGNADFLLLKVSSDGVLEWAKAYGGTGYDDGMHIALTPDMGYVMAGVSESYLTNATLVIKTSSDGTVQWAKVYRFYPWASTSLGVLDLTSDGGFVLRGSYNADNIYVVKLSSTGVVQWAKKIDGPASDEPSQIIETSDGGFVVVGETESWGFGSNDAIVVKLAANGDIQWARAYGTSGYDRALGVAEVADGNLVITGFEGLPDSDILLFKVSMSDGSLIWWRAFESGGSLAYYPLATADNCVAVAAGMYTLKVDLDGNLIWARSNPIRAYTITGKSNGYIVYGGYASPNNGDFGLVVVGLDGVYQGCLTDVPLSPISLNLASTPITTGENVSVSSIDVSPSVSSPAILTTTLCAPVDLGETSAEKDHQVLCLTAPDGIVFRSQIADLTIRIYTSDGRVAYSGQLRQGENRISLNRGVYLWQAGTYRGKAAVR
jgi:hypothetical protein